MALRRVLFGRGFRYRVHRPVPGLSRRTVDIVFPRAMVAVFVDGCFWHGCPEHGMLPRSNREWWQHKLDNNRRRDQETSAHLVKLGWTVLRFWSHDTPDVMADSVVSAVESRRAGLPIDGLPYW
jgi:DNA mismatch endonuclease (patch repair protein)